MEHVQDWELDRGERFDGEGSLWRWVWDVEESGILRTERKRSADLSRFRSGLEIDSSS